MIIIIQINKLESIYIRERSPTTHIGISSRSKNSRGKSYFTEETGIVFRLLREFRESQLNGQK